MKTLLTFVLAVCFTLVLGAQTNFEPATSLVNEFATASINNDFDFAPETAAEPTLEEVENYFNIRFTSNPIFGDINIVYDLATTTNVTVEVVRGDKTVFSSSKTLVSGTQETVWDENISSGSGVHTIKVIANNKVEALKIRL